MNNAIVGHLKSFLTTLNSLLDGNFHTYWQSDGITGTHWIRYECYNNHIISSYVISWLLLIVIYKSIANNCVHYVVIQVIYQARCGISGS